MHETDQNLCDKIFFDLHVTIQNQIHIVSNSYAICSLNVCNCFLFSLGDGYQIAQEACKEDILWKLQQEKGESGYNLPLYVSLSLGMMHMGTAEKQSQLNLIAD